MLPQQPFAPSLPDPSSPIRAHRGWDGHCWSCSPRRGGSEAGKRVLRGSEKIFSGSNASGIHLHLGMNSCNGTHTHTERGTRAQPQTHITPAQHRDMEGMKGKREGKDLPLLLPKLQIAPTPCGQPPVGTASCSVPAEVSPARAAPSSPSLLAISTFFLLLLFSTSFESQPNPHPPPHGPHPLEPSILGGAGAAAGAVRAGRLPRAPAPGAASRAPPPAPPRLTHGCCQREKVSDLKRWKCFKPRRRRAREGGKPAFPKSREKAAAPQRDKHITPPQNHGEGAAGSSAAPLRSAGSAQAPLCLH